MTRNEALAAYFAANPAVTMLVVESGHAYGRAKFDSTCKLTRTQIERGEDVRRIVVQTRRGQTAEVYVANRTYGVLVGAGAVARIEFGGGRIDALPVQWTRYTGVGAVESMDLDSVAGEVTIELVTRYGECKKFVRGSAVNGKKWNGSRSTKAMISGLRRSKSYRMVRVSTRDTEADGGLGWREYRAIAA